MCHPSMGYSGLRDAVGRAQGGSVGSTRRAILAILAVAPVGACKADLPGFYWELEQSLNDDTCNAQPVSPPTDPFEYRLQFDVNDLVLAIGEDEFATGTVQGCVLAYETVVWPEDRNDYRLAWQMRGAATVSRGGTDGCPVDNGSDWSGTEVFTIITSEDPDLSPGCTYTVNLSGSYTKEVQ